MTLISACPQAAFRAGMSDQEFWDHLLGVSTGREEDFDPPDDPDMHVLVSLPCPECEAVGACAWDMEGRPLIHASTATSEDDR